MNDQHPQKSRCISVRNGLQCGLPIGHDGDHTTLIPSDAPWFDEPAPAMKAPDQTVARSLTYGELRERKAKA